MCAGGGNCAGADAEVDATVAAAAAAAAAAAGAGGAGAGSGAGEGTGAGDGPGSLSIDCDARADRFGTRPYLTAAQTHKRYTRQHNKSIIWEILFKISTSRVGIHEVTSPNMPYTSTYIRVPTSILHSTSENVFRTTYIM